jgi:hypothetical protein
MGAIAPACGARNGERLVVMPGFVGAEQVVLRLFLARGIGLMSIVGEFETYGQPGLDVRYGGRLSRSQYCGDGAGFGPLQTLAGRDILGP